MGTQINNLTTIQALTADALFPVYDNGNGDTRKVSMGAIADYINSASARNISGYATVYSAPSVDAFTILSAANAVDNTHIIVTPTASFTTGALTLPLATGASDGQMLLLNCTAAVTTFTYNLNGASGVIGAPTTISVNSFFTLKFDKATKNWYRVG